MTESPVVATAPVRVGVVSYLNTLPLIDGLEQLVDLALKPSVPSLLLGMLEAGEVELALCSSIDYQRSAIPLVIVPAGILGCEGPTMTVRLYSQSPIESLTSVHVDTDSHTSVVLLQILLHTKWGIRPQLISYGAREHVAESRPIEWPEAMLLIGDKVVTDSPPAVRYPHQLDLGEAWFELTGLPFVFAVWMARASAHPDQIRMAARVLDRQRRHNLERVDGIIQRRAVPRQWPADLARTYLTQRLRFAWGDSTRLGLERFFMEAARIGAIKDLHPIRVLEL